MTLLFFTTVDIFETASAKLDTVALKHLKTIQDSTGCKLIDCSYDRMFANARRENANYYQKTKLNVSFLPEPKGGTTQEQIDEVVKKIKPDKWLTISSLDKFNPVLQFKRMTKKKADEIIRKLS